MSTTEIPNIGKKANTQVQKVSNNVTTFKGLPANRINEVLMSYEKTMTDLLKSEEMAKRAIQVITILVKKNSQLQECSPNSIIGGMLQAAMLGLDFNPSLGLCYLVPRSVNIAPKNQPKKYIKEAEFQLGYRGMLNIVNNSDIVSEVFAEVKYEGDEWELEYGLNRRLKHVPKFLHIGDSTKIEFAYAVVKTTKGGIFYSVISRSQIEALRLLNESQRKYGLSGAWASHYAEMAKAKAVKGLFKYVPSDIENRKLATDGTIIKVSENNPNQLEVTTVEEIEVQVIDNDNGTQPELTDEEWFNQNAEEIAKAEKEQLFDEGK